MRVRPSSVTVIGWFLVVTALLSLFSDIRKVVRPRVRATVASSTVPQPLQHALSWLGTAINLVCGYFLLRGKNWARYTEIVWSLAMLAYGYFTSPLPWMLAIGLAFECVMIYLLFRPRANAFFSAENAGLPIQNEMSKRQIASTCYYVAAGGFLATNALVALMFPKEMSPFLFVLVFGPIATILFSLLVIGKWLSTNPNWLREIGIVFLASAVIAVLFQLLIAMYFSSAEYLETLAPGKSVPELDFVTGVAAVAIAFFMGGLMYWLGRRTVRNQTPITRR